MVKYTQYFHILLLRTYVSSNRSERPEPVSIVRISTIDFKSKVDFLS